MTIGEASKINQYTIIFLVFECAHFEFNKGHNYKLSQSSILILRNISFRRSRERRQQSDRPELTGSPLNGATLLEYVRF